MKLVPVMFWVPAFLSRPLTFLGRLPLRTVSRFQALRESFWSWQVGIWYKKHFGTMPVWMHERFGYSTKAVARHPSLGQDLEMSNKVAEMLERGRTAEAAVPPKGGFAFPTPVEAVKVP